MIDYYKGWTIQLVLEDRHWQVNLINPEGNYSGIGCLVGMHSHPGCALIEAKEWIDRRNAWTLLRQTFRQFRDRGLICEQEWDNLSDSLTCWFVH
ncbi:hypothetical protein [Roseofilum casamattae]|uniref:Uncharacterized protein n=1 Tax=Roseofilum casamattae BLCC-M143 TaxID=3022442 RepID=A0ABT7BVC4_9CYAN|nr:hypothetical protein [Roseofilum casamattae]MDJ1183146.1 hypothetical protein [Roseofilum casamattae BLCC-M143]